CHPCNNRLGAIEEDVAIRMWSCIDPSKPGAQGLRRKVMEHFGIGVRNLNKKEREIRDKLRQKFVQEMKPVTDPSMKAFPGFGLHKESSIEDQRQINIPIEKLYAVAEKIFRGLEYRYQRKWRYVEDPYKLEIFPSTREDELPGLISLIDKLPS